MKKIIDYINKDFTITEKFRFSDDMISIPKFEYFPKSSMDLQRLISEKYKINSTVLDLRDIDVSKITNMTVLFENCINTEKIDISTWDTSNVVKFTAMFAGCKNLKEIVGIEDLNVFEGIFFANMFADTKIQEIDLSRWNLKTDPHINKQFFAFFKNCKQLKKCDVSTWKLQDRDCISEMFCGCKKLKELKIFDKPAPNKQNKPAGRISLTFEGVKDELIPDWYKNM